MRGGGLLLIGLIAASLMRVFLAESDIDARYPLPSILDEEPYIAVTYGEEAKLHCRTACGCNGTTMPNVSWSENGDDVKQDETVFVSSDGVLHVKNCTHAIARRVFRCIATLGNASIMGVERRLYIFDPSSPALLLQTSSLVSIGASTVFRCIPRDRQVFNVSGLIRWMKDGKEMQATKARNFYTIPGGYLIFSSFHEEDTGQYRCTASLAALKGPLVSNIVPVIAGHSDDNEIAPYFSHVLRTIDAVEGSQTSMVCAAKGNPIPMVTIYYEQVLVNSIIVARGTGVANATFAPVQTQHAGRYVCSIRSKRSAVRREIRLRVASPPRWESVPLRRKLTTSRSTLSLKCSATGLPSPVVTWFKDGRHLQQSEQTKSYKTGEVKVEPVVPEIAGIYQCIATNRLGSSSHATRVMFVTSLLPPYDVRVEPVSPTAIKVKWRINQLNDPKAVLAHVIIYVFFSEAQQGRVQREIVIFDNDDTEHVVSQLYGGTNYYINMCTYSVNGVKGAYSKVAIGKTLESAPNMPPYPAKVVNLGGNMIRVIWTPILQQYSNGEVIRYRINYGIAGSILNSLFVAPDKTQVDISNLKVGELYTVEVLAATSGGFSQPEVLTITIGDPKITSQKGPPSKLFYLNSTALRVDWTVADPNYVTGFILYFVQVPYADFWYSVKVFHFKQDKRSFLIGNINPRKNYRIEIRTKSGPMLSKPSVVVRTARVITAVPSDLAVLKVSGPRNLECAVRGNNSIFLTWSAPTFATDLDHYMVEIVMGGRPMDAIRTYRSDEMKYLLTDLPLGTWYYLRVNAIAKPERVKEISRKLRRKIKVPKYKSDVVACMTKETLPSAPANIYCNVTKHAHDAVVIWYPPERPYGLILKYVVRYIHLVRPPRKTEWKEDTVVMRPNKKGYPLVYDLDVEYYRRYRIEVYAVNSAGQGPPAVVESCALRRHKNPMRFIRYNNSKKVNSVMGDDTKLGIIIGCSVASVFIVTFIVIFIWKNPFRVKSSDNSRQSDSRSTNTRGLYKDDFLYLQRLAESQGNASLGMKDDCTQQGASNRSRNRHDGATDASQPLMSKYQTTVEVTGSSSGQPVCSCSCLLQGHAHGHMTQPKGRCEVSADVSRDGMDQKPEDGKPQIGTLNVHEEIDADSTESADSTTQILPLSSSADTSNTTKDPSTMSSSDEDAVKETSFQVEV